MLSAGVGVLYAPAACSINSFTIHAIASTGGADTTTFVVRHNGTGTSMGCSVTVNGNTATCSDTVHGFTVAVNDTIEYQVSQTNGSPTVFYSMQLLCQ
jgi:hypothetical protein